MEVIPPQTPFPQTPQQLEASSPLHAFSIDDNDNDDDENNDDNDDDENKNKNGNNNNNNNNALESPEQNKRGRRASWLEKTLGLQLPFGGGDESPSNENVEDGKEQEGDGGIDSDSDGDVDENASSASGSSVILQD
eukprot:CAMPEP_0174825548 /NCGR_PEP_ID=MMETSP1107-20130205/42868_1 /TAXON_ID=36770 /ORGANISM="Paraphysomonas vestita, Strain GFlagA" /LENGTH=135 /DNA_ID=CAMNT_0016057269 /DNA_START=685 /DNA_END=1093 /DNA_ORIENTATION=+